MNLDESYIYRKEVDWSLLHEGLTIPVRIQIAFRSLLKGYERGVGRKISLLIDGLPFEAMLVNQAFDRENTPVMPTWYRSDLRRKAGCRRNSGRYFRQVTPT